MHRPGYTPVADLPVGQQGEYNIPPDDDENEGYGGALSLPRVPRKMPVILPTLLNRGALLPSSESGDSSFSPEKQETLPELSANADIYVLDTVRVPRHHHYRWVINLSPTFGYERFDPLTEREEEIPSESSYDMPIPQMPV